MKKIKSIRLILAKLDLGKNILREYKRYYCNTWWFEKIRLNQILKVKKNVDQFEWNGSKLKKGNEMKRISKHWM